MRFRAIAFGLTLVGLIFAVPSHLLAYTGEKLAKGAKVNIEDARAMRSKLNRERFPTEELEREGRQPSSLRLRYQEWRRKVRSRSGCANWQGS